MWREYEVSRCRTAELLEEAERWRTIRLVRRAPCKPSLRARVARRLIDAAFALESCETWQAVWERMILRDRA